MYYVYKQPDGFPCVTGHGQKQNEINKRNEVNKI